MQLRPYQQEAREAVKRQWDEGTSKTLLVLPTGTGKTIVFSKLIEDRVVAGDKVLVLAHRGELLDQAADKLAQSTGLACAREKAEDTCLGSWNRVVVGSVQTLQRETRLSRFAPDYFGTIIVDEAHHALSDGYRRVLDYFGGARVLGVTATPDRGDMRNLGRVFDSLAYEYTLTRAIKDGYLSPIKALTIPLTLDISGVGTQGGDYSVGELGTALDPYLEQIAQEMSKTCAGRKTVVFLPLVRTSQKFRDILCTHGFKAAEVNGESTDRAQVLEDFADGKYDVLCNSMLLTEGWDCPIVDCIVVLRPTKVNSLYCLDEQTEILTEDGWKSDVSVGENVATFNVKNGSISFEPTIATVRRRLDSDEYFCSVSGPQIDIRVTNKHRILYDNKRRLGWKIKEAEHVAGLKDGAFIPVSGHGNFKGVPLTDDELRFIGWVLSDGSINKTNGAITITQGAHQPWLELIQDCINGCGFKYGRSERSRTNAFDETSNAVKWTISKGHPRGRDRHLRGWGELEPYISKQISDALCDMSEVQFDVMLEAIHFGDGAKQVGQPWTRRSYHISTGDKVYAERLQIMAIQRGWKANISVQVSQSGNNCYLLHMKKKDRICLGSTYDGRPIWKKEEHTDEQCWCVQTEAGTIVTRRNGKVAIVGNCQMVGRGTRLHPGKTELLLLDFLWHTQRMELCHPASLICEDEKVAQRMTEIVETASAGGEPIDIEEAEREAAQDVIAQREEALAKQLHEMRTRKRALVDPLQFEMSIQAEDLVNYTPSFGWQMAPPTDDQKKALEKIGILPDEIDNAGKAKLLLDRLTKRRVEGLTTPKQIRFLEGRGFQHVGTWPFDSAKGLIDRIAGNGWRIPHGVTPATYSPQGE